MVTDPAFQKPRRVTDKRGGLIDPDAKVGSSRYQPSFGRTPDPDASAPRETPRDTSPDLKSAKVEPIVTRETPRPDLKRPF